MNEDASEKKVEKEVIITAASSIQQGLTISNDKNNSIKEILVTIPKAELKETKALTSLSEVNLEKDELSSQKDILDLTKSEKIKINNKKTKEKIKDAQLIKLDILKKLSSGTGLREGIDNIVSGGMGALILVENSNSSNIFQGGFKINCKFSSKKLFELAKMDGAIILSEDFKKILYANTLLTPNKTITTSETGTRHQAAERSAKQTGGIVIAVSQRIGKITIYFGNSKYVLQNSEDLLRRATETMQILEKQREVFDELIINLNLLEINNMVSVADVCAILERLEMIRKMANIINEYIVELGKEGIILRMRMRELTKGIDKTQDLILKDYFSRPAKVRQFFDSLAFDGLLDLDNIAKALFKNPIESSIIPKGYRILSKTHFPKEKIDAIVKHFGNLDRIFGASRESLGRILKSNPELFLKELQNIREHILVGKKI
ncbi:MAG: DNA integrity scanning diadenylate cyclase DisA [Candidatus Pacearchaeota archaeon]